VSFCKIDISLEAGILNSKGLLGGIDVGFYKHFDLSNFKDKSSKSLNYINFESIKLEVESSLNDDEPLVMNMSILGANVFIDTSISSWMRSLNEVYLAGMNVDVGSIIPTDSLRKPMRRIYEKIPASDKTPVDSSTIVESIFDLRSNLKFGETSITLLLSDIVKQQFILPSATADVVIKGKDVKVSVDISSSENTVRALVLQFYKLVFSDTLSEKTQTSVDLDKIGDFTRESSISVAVVLNRSILILEADEILATFRLERVSLHFGSDQSAYSLSGTIENVKMDLKHRFSPEGCLDFVLADLSLSVSMGKELTRSIIIQLLFPSGVEFEFNLRHLHDLVYFQKAWIPKKRAIVSKDKEISAMGESAFQIDFSVFVSQEVKLAVDLGPSVGKAALRFSGSFLSF
jgi:hypothetical protein